MNSDDMDKAIDWLENALSDLKWGDYALLDRKRRQLYSWVRQAVLVLGCIVVLFSAVPGIAFGRGIVMDTEGRFVDTAEDVEVFDHGPCNEVRGAIGDSIRSPLTDKLFKADCGFDGPFRGDCVPDSWINGAFVQLNASRVDFAPGRRSLCASQKAFQARRRATRIGKPHMDGGLSIGTYFRNSDRINFLDKEPRTFDAARRLLARFNGRPSDDNQGKSKEGERHIARPHVALPGKFDWLYVLGFGAIGCVGLYLLSFKSAAINVVGGACFAIGLMCSFYGGLLASWIAGR